MSSIRDWFPTKREAQLAMAKNWLTILKTQGPAWGVPQKDIDDLAAATAKADATLNLAHSSERTQVITAQCKEDFDALEEIMRYMKNHFFLSPPRTSVEMISLELKPTNPTHTIRGRPRAQMSAEIGRSGTLMLILKLVYAEGTEHLANPHTDQGFQIRYGKYSPSIPSTILPRGKLPGRPARRRSCLLSSPPSGNGRPSPLTLGTAGRPRTSVSASATGRAGRTPMDPGARFFKR